MDELLELERQIAAALGYIDLERDTYWEENPWSGSYEVECWRGRRPDDRSSDYLPDWSKDLNAAMALFDNTKIKLIIRHATGNEWWVGYQYPSGVGSVYVPGSGSYYPMAEAVARAWLRWHEAQQYPEGGIVWPLPNSDAE